MKIDSYSFGTMVVEGAPYTVDLILLPDQVLPNWRRTAGHIVAPEDLTRIVEIQPELVIFGTGFYGEVKVSSAAQDLMKNEGISWVAERTEEAVRIYNERSGEGRVVGAFHLTC